MILHETQNVQIAEADWTDDGIVALLTFPTLEGHTTRMAPETARALAQQLNDAAKEAERAIGEVAAQRAHRAVQHGFDADMQHDWRWGEHSFGDPVCARCGQRATSTLVQRSACPGPLEVPEVQS